jgi:hypothetical protein
MIVETTSGLVISSFLSETSGEPVANIVLIDGDLLLVPVQTRNYV